MKWILVLALLFWAAPAAPRDFAAPFIGAQAVISGENPYSEAVTARNQLASYGRLAEPGEDEQRTAYPVSSLLLLTPFLPLGIEKAALVYRVLGGFLLIFGTFRAQKSFKWAILAVIVLREPIVAYMLANMALLMAGFVTLGVSFLKERRDYPAMLCFVGASISPVIGIPLAILLLWKRWYMLSLYFTLLGGLVLFSFLIAGFWLPDWVQTMIVYPQYTEHGIWMPVLIPVAALIWIIRRDNNAAVAAVLLGMPLTAAHQINVALGIIERKRILICGLILWSMALFLPHTLRLQLNPIVIAIHLLGLPDLRTLFPAARAATRNAAAVYLQRVSVSPAKKESGAAPNR